MPVSAAGAGHTLSWPPQSLKASSQFCSYLYFLMHQSEPFLDKLLAEILANKTRLFKLFFNYKISREIKHVYCEF